MSDILIIGSAGRMGRWFLKYFLRQRKILEKENPNNYNISRIFLYDLKNIDPVVKNRYKDVYISKDLNGIIRNANIILFCTPTENTVKILKKYKKFFRDDSVVIEISSIKQPIFKVIRKLSTESNNIITLCIHPMFGPGAKFISKRNKILQIPVNTKKFDQEKIWINKIFPYYEKIIINTSKDHDILISIIISLIYFMNLVFSNLLLEISTKYASNFNTDMIEMLKLVGGSSFKIQTLLSESILSDDVGLFVNLFTNNKKGINIIRNYGAIYSNLLRKLEKNEIDVIKKFIIDTQNGISKSVDIEKSYSNLYRILNRENLGN